MILLASCAPALAYSPNAAAQQYSEVSPSAVEVGDVIRAAADSAARGTGALNGTFSDDKSSAAAAATLSGGDQPDPDGKVAGLTELPRDGRRPVVRHGRLYVAGWRRCSGPQDRSVSKQLDVTFKEADPFGNLSLFERSRG